MNEIPNFPQNSVSFLLFSFCVPLSHTCFKISSCSMCQRQGGGATPENIEHRTHLWSSWWCDVGSIRPSDCMNVCSVVGVGVIVIWLYWRVFIYIGLPVSTRGGESAINISIPGPWFLAPPSTGPYPAHCDVRGHVTTICAHWPQVWSGSSMLIVACIWWQMQFICNAIQLIELNQYNCPVIWLMLSYKLNLIV